MTLDTFAQLKELVHIFTVAAPSRTHFFSREKLSDPEIGYARLFQVIAEDPTATEKEVAQRAFGVGPKENSYLIQRSVLKDMLLNSLFALDVEAAGFTDLGVEAYKNDRQMFETRVLHSWSWPFAVKTASQALPAALERERWHNALLFLDTLREAAAIEGDIAAFDQYATEFRRVMDIYVASQAAAEANERMMCLSARYSGEQPQLADIAAPALLQVREVLAKYPCFTLNYEQWKLECAVAQSTGQYALALELSESFESLVRAQYPQMMGNALAGQIARKRLTCALRIRRFKLAEAALEDAKAVVAPARLNWLLLLQQQYILHMHQGQFEEALALITDCFQKGLLDQLPRIHRERWTLFEAFARLALGDTTLKFSRAKLDSKLRTDKSGANAVSILLEGLLLLRSRKLRELSSQAEALDKYLNRYLQGAENAQMRRLFKLLLLAIRQGNNKKSFDAKSEQILKEAEEDLTSDPVEGFQIVPFATIFSWISSWCFDTVK